MIYIPFQAIGNAAAIAPAENKSMLGIILASKPSSGRATFDVLVKRIRFPSAQLTAATGVGLALQIRRLSALVVGGGAAGAVNLLDLADAAHIPTISTIVSAFTGGTATSAGVLEYAAVNNDEIPLTGQAYNPMQPLWEAPAGCEGIVLRPGFGLDVVNTTNSTVGGFNPIIEGVLRWG